MSEFSLSYFKISAIWRFGHKTKLDRLVRLNCVSQRRNALAFSAIYHKFLIGKKSCYLWFLLWSSCPASFWPLWWPPLWAFCWSGVKNDYLFRSFSRRQKLSCYFKTSTTPTKRLARTVCNKDELVRFMCWKQSRRSI